MGQTLHDIEIICVDDRSTDDSRKILAEYASQDERVHVVTRENRGQSVARNTGLSVAQAPFIMFCDSDDWYEPTMCEKMYGAMQNGADMAVCAIQQTDLSGTSFISDCYFTLPAVGEVAASDELLLRCDACLPSKIFKKKVIKSNGICFPEGVRFEDEFFFGAYSAHIKTINFINEKLYHYRRHSDSFMHRLHEDASEEAIDRVRVVNLLWLYYEERNLVESKIIFLVGKWLQQCYCCLLEVRSKEQQRVVEAIAIPFAQEKILPLNAVNCLPAVRKRLNLLVRGKWVGIQSQWRGALRKYVYDSLNISVFHAVKKIKFFGITVGKTIYRGERKCSYLFGALPMGKKLPRGEEPLVTVLIPVYNAECYLEDSINSILGQTFQDFELLLINDGSTDKSLEIATSFHDPRIRIINNKENRGLVQTLNQGISAARGELLARMDADDIAFPQRLAKQVDYMDRHPRVGIVGTWYFMFGGRTSSLIRTPRRVSVDDLLQGSPLGHPTVMMRASVLRKYHLFYQERYKHAEDYELWVRAFRHTELANLQEMLLLYRVHNTQVSSLYRTEQAKITAVVRQRARLLSGGLRNNTPLLEILPPQKNSVLNVLSSIGEFAYTPNSGNMGDALIASATMQWMDVHNLPWSRCSQEEHNPRCFVYGGGGAWLPEWIDALHPIMEKMQRAQRVIVLPSTFRDVPQLVNILDKRFTVFCREKKSYDYLADQHTGAEILMGHDMALHMQRDPVASAAPTARLRKAARALHRALANLPEENVRFMRRDREACDSLATISDFDLSDALGWFSPYEARENIDFAAAEMLRAVCRFTHIHTDRLHVGIAAALVGVTTTLYDNNTSKVSGVYAYSLADLPHISYISKHNYP